MTAGAATDALVAELLDAAAAVVPSGDLAPALAAIRSRYEQPVHLAVLGPRGTGVSTLVNALLGTRLSPAAPGGAGGMPVWFLHGEQPDVRAVHLDGSATPLRFEQHDQLVVDTEALDLPGVHHLEVRWPVPVLRHVVLVDAGDHPADTSHADAHLVVLPDAAAELEPAARGLGTTPSPVNTITAITRGDEAGDARPDAMGVARDAAAAVGALAVCGLLAEAAACLPDDDVEVLRSVAALPDGVRAALLASADRFETLDVEVPAVARERVARRVGLLGVRSAVDLLAAHRDATTADVRRAWHQASGLDHLTAALRSVVLERAALLRVATAIGALRSLAHRLAAIDHTRGTELERSIARTVGSLPELDQLRVLHLAVTGQLPLDHDEVDDLRRLWGHGSARARLALPEDAAAGTVRAVVLAAVARWRERGDDLFAGADLRDACATVIRSLEALHQSVTDG